LLASLRALPRPVWVLCAGIFINRSGAFVIPFLALYLTGRGHSVNQAGLALGAYGVGNLVATLLGGHLADTLGRRNTIAWAMFSSAAILLALSQAESFAAIVAWAFLTGLTGELSRPAAAALLADVVQPEQRVTAYAAYRVSLNAGWAFGPAMAGLLAQYSFLWLFVGNAATSCAFGLLAWKALPHGICTAPTARPWNGVWLAVRRDRRFQRYIAASFAVGLVFMQMGTTFGLHVTACGFSPAVYGVLISLNGVLVVLIELPLTAWTRRLPARPVMAAGYLLIGLGFGFNAFAHTVPMLALAMFLFTLGEIFSMPVASGYLANLAPEEIGRAHV